MHIAGIVCEYNPFHNGHKCHIEKTRVSGATHIVCVMSGNFVQRGEPAIISKRIRTECAIKNGADLVIELPLPWSCAAAQTFARGAVGLLNAVNSDTISFGSECADVNLIKQCAEATQNESVKQLIQKYTALTGYPCAVRNAVCEIYAEKYASVFDNPNDTLNIEYINAIKALNSKMQPLAVKREAAHDTDISSAKNIRNLISNNGEYKPLMPVDCVQLIEEQIKRGYAPASLEVIERAVLMKLRGMSVQQLSDISDVTQGLENRIYRCVRLSSSLSELYDTLKTKRYTAAKIRRIILSCFLDIHKADSEGIPPYIRVLGANEKGKEILSAVKHNSGLPIFTKYSEIETMPEKCKRIFALESRAGDIYSLCTPKIRPCGTEMTDKSLFI